MSSICRLNNWSERCENILNEQINLEYWASLQYHTMFAYFDRDYVGLKNIAEFFNKSSHEEREHAHKFIKYQNMRGGKVVIGDVKDFEFDVDIDSIFSSNNNTPNEENTNNFHNHDVLEGFNKALEMEQKAKQDRDFKGGLWGSARSIEAFNHTHTLEDFGFDIKTDAEKCAVDGSCFL